VEVEQVVVRQLLAVQRLRRCNAGRALSRLNIECRLLVRIFSVTQSAAALEVEVERCREVGRAGCASEAASEISADRRVVGGDAGEGGIGKAFARLQVQATVGAQFVEDGG